MKKFFIWGFLGLASIAGLYATSNWYTDIHTVTGQGTLSHTAIWYITSGYDAYFKSDGSTTDFSIVDTTVTVANDLVLPENIRHGSYTTAITTANTAGNSYGTIMQAFLAASPHEQAAVEGDSLCAATTTANGYVEVKVCEPSVALGTWVGIAAAAASTGTFVSVYNDGWVLARTTGTVAVGDYLATTNKGSGILATTTNSTHNVVGIAQNSLASTEGTLRLKIKIK